MLATARPDQLMRLHVGLASACRELDSILSGQSLDAGESHPDRFASDRDDRPAPQGGARLNLTELKQGMNALLDEVAAALGRHGIRLPTTSRYGVDAGESHPRRFG